MAPLVLTERRHHFGHLDLPDSAFVPFAHNRDESYDCIAPWRMCGFLMLRDMLVSCGFHQIPPCDEAVRVLQGHPEREIFVFIGHQAVQRWNILSEDRHLNVFAFAVYVRAHLPVAGFVLATAEFPNTTVQFPNTVLPARGEHCNLWLWPWSPLFRPFMSCMRWDPDINVVSTTRMIISYHLLLGIFISSSLEQQKRTTSKWSFQAALINQQTHNFQLGGCQEHSDVRCQSIFSCVGSNCIRSYLLTRVSTCTVLQCK